MNLTVKTYLGYQALILKYQLRVPPLSRVFLATVSVSARSRAIVSGEELVELPLQRVADTNSVVWQLSFPFKRETLNLTVLGALFEVPEVIDAIGAWLRNKPSSKYSRMAGHPATGLGRC